MALVQHYTNTRSRNHNQRKMLTRSCNNSPVTNKFKNSINLNMTIPASNFRNRMNVRTGALVPLTGVMSEKNMCNIISSSIKQSHQVIPKKEPKKKLKVGMAFRKSMRLLIRNQGTMSNISGISTCSEIPQPITLPRTVEFFTDIRNYSQSHYKSQSKQPDGLKILYLSALGLYRTQVGDMDHQRQILEEECNKFHTIKLNSSFHNNAVSSVEDDTNTIISPPIVKPHFEAPERGTCKLKGRNESVQWDVNMTVVFTPLGDQYIKNEIDAKSEESDVSSCNLQSDEDEFTAFTQDTVKTEFNNISGEIETWQSFDTYMKDQLEQEQIECTPKTNCKQEIKDAKRKLVELRRQWSSWKCID